MIKISVLKVKEWGGKNGYDDGYAVIISEEGKPHQTYCIYSREAVAYRNAHYVAEDLGGVVI